MDMSSLKGKGKREQREYLDTIRGLTHAMAAQVFCLAFEGHCVPVDERTLAALKDAGALEENCDLQHAENIVTRCVKAGEAVEAFLALHAWVDANPPKNWPLKPLPTPVYVAPAAPAKKAAVVEDAAAAKKRAACARRQARRGQSAGKSRPSQGLGESCASQAGRQNGRQARSQEEVIYRPFFAPPISHFTSHHVRLQTQDRLPQRQPRRSHL